MMIVNGLNPRVFISSLYFGIVWARLVLKRTVVGDWHLNLSKSQVQSQVNSVWQLMMLLYKSGPLKVIGQFSHDGIGWKTCVKFVISHWSVSISQIGQFLVRILLQQTPLDTCQQLQAPYKRLIDDGNKTNKQTSNQQYTDRDFSLGCWNVTHQQQFLSGLPAPGRSHNTNYGALGKNNTVLILNKN